MSGAVEGVNIGATLAAADYLISLYERLWKGGVVRDLAEAIGTYDRLKLASLTAPPARTYAEGVSASEMVARWQQEYLATPGAHWGDTIAWNNAFVIAAKLDESATIRLLSQGGGK